MSDGAVADCADDSECKAGICDSDQVCTPVDNASRLGTVCETPAIDLDEMTRAKLDTCGAYRCINGRCRSCQTDDECRTSSDNPEENTITCQEVAGKPGKRCGRYQ